MHQGFPVPPGFVVTVDAYAEFVDIDSLPSNDEIGADADSFCASIRYKITSTAISRAIEDQLRSHHEALQKARDEEIVYAVRSSATAENLG
ncbi:MAG: hypothetical protein CMQ19_14730 [Gammaproteobacteria bacterium]|nr:hypothetical protein [Gammaproteobacteria bacterium]